MILETPTTVQVPLRTDSQGVVRVGDTRVTLAILIARFNQGDAPEVIQAAFSTVPLSDIYAVISYYLAHREVVDTYLAELDAEGERIQAQWEAKHPSPSKDELYARLGCADENLHY